MKRFLDFLWHNWLKQPYRLHVVHDAGDPVSKSPVLLLHGLASDGSVWQPLTSKIDMVKHRLIVLDLLGFGASPRPDHLAYNVDHHARAVLKTLQSLRANSHKVTIIAHSMGCLVATHIATLAPEKVKRLILYEPPLFADDPVYRSHRRRAAKYLAFYQYLTSHPELLMLQHRRVYRLAQRMSGIVLSPEAWLPFERSLRNTIMRQQAYAELHTIKITTDIIHGRLDLVVVRAEVKKMFESNPYIALHMVTAFHGITQKSALYLNKLLEVRV